MLPVFLIVVGGIIMLADIIFIFQSGSWFFCGVAFILAGYLWSQLREAISQQKTKEQLEQSNEQLTQRVEEAEQLNEQLKRHTDG